MACSCAPSNRMDSRFESSGDRVVQQRPSSLVLSVGPEPISNWIKSRDAVTGPASRPARYRCNIEGKLAPFAYQIHMEDCGMKLFVGLDVSLEKTAICVISEHGRILKEAQVASEPDALLRWINDQDGGVAAVGLEAGPLSQWLHRRNVSTTLRQWVFGFRLGLALFSWAD
jgi:hypothetical protein